MVLCVGEIILDMTGKESEDGSSIVFDSHAGGASLNVACQMAKLGFDSAVLGSVGDDVAGRFLVGYAKRIGLKQSYLSVLEDRNTTLAFVSHDRNGDRDFSFYRKRTADTKLKEVDLDFLSGFSMVHIGSMMLSEESGLRYALSLIDKARILKIPVSFDVNYRKDIYQDEMTALKRSKEVIEQADIVKFSKDEVELFGEDYVYGLAKSRRLFITDGNRGSAYFYRDISVSAPTFKVHSVDTTGAGDSFYGAVLGFLDQGKEDFNHKVKEHLLFANACGALTTMKLGAIDGMPDLKQVQDFLREQI